MENKKTKIPNLGTTGTFMFIVYVIITIIVITTLSVLSYNDGLKIKEFNNSPYGKIASLDIKINDGEIIKTKLEGEVKILTKELNKLNKKLEKVNEDLIENKKEKVNILNVDIVN